MYLRFGQPIDTGKPSGQSTEKWVASVRDTTQRSLETIPTDLLAIRSEDPFRELNPLARAGAVQAGE
jgi:hypothetical protein